MFADLRSVFKNAAENIQAGFNNFDSMTGKQKLTTVASFALGVAGLATVTAPAAAWGIAVTASALALHGREITNAEAAPAPRGIA